VLTGLRVVELASEHGAYAGKLLADLGADVVVVEPPGGHKSRGYGPFANDSVGDPERSLWWWNYNTSKRSVVMDVDSEPGRDALRQLIDSADIVLEAESVRRLAEIGLDYEQILVGQPTLIWISITPYGRQLAAAEAPVTDLTLLAGGGAIWNCGYDDHETPPVRGGGNQAFHIAGTFAVMSGLTAVLNRDVTGLGQHVDVSMHAAVNVSTESGTFVWLVKQGTVHRQTGRHAAEVPTLPVQVLAADGRWVTTGFPPHEADDFRRILDWLAELDLTDQFPEAFFLELGVESGGVDYARLADDPEAIAIFAAGREALVLIASSLPAYEFFRGAQDRDFQCGIVYSPEEALEDPHFIARGFPVSVFQPQLGREVRYPGAPFRASRNGWKLRRPAPMIGQHTTEVLGDLTP
jgi:crotonobetainyl-CoA:carnitine CoA-transferase CaiB-like acyl-CoA transferase